MKCVLLEHAGLPNVLFQMTVMDFFLGGACASLKNSGVEKYIVVVYSIIAFLLAPNWLRSGVPNVSAKLRRKHILMVHIQR